MTDRLADFLMLASDLYATDPGYRAEVDAERGAAYSLPYTEATIVDRLDELDWLLANGSTVDEAIRQVGGQRDTLVRYAQKHGRPALARRVADRDSDMVAGGCTDRWAARWLAGKIDRFEDAA